MTNRYVVAARAQMIWLAVGLSACGLGAVEGSQGPSERDATSVTLGGGGVRARDGGAEVDGSVRDAGAPSGPRDASVIADEAGAQRAWWLLENHGSVFFVGNSFFNYGGRVLPEWVEAVGQAVTPKFEFETGSHIVPGNNPLSWFFDQSASQQAIASKKYELFILQGEEMEPVEDKQGFQNAVRDYHRAVTANGGKLMLFMTWDFKWNQGDNGAFFDKLSSAYDEIGEELGVPVIPVGKIYADINDDLPPGQSPYFLNGGDLHQTESGSAVNAYATFSMLTGIDPMGVPFSANGNTNSAALLGYLSDKAWLRVNERLHY